MVISDEHSKFSSIFLVSEVSRRGKQRENLSVSGYSVTRWLIRFYLEQSLGKLIR